MIRVCQRLKSVIVTPAVYPRFLKSLHVDIQSTGHTLSWPWSRQMNDVGTAHGSRTVSLR